MTDSDMPYGEITIAQYKEQYTGVEHALIDVRMPEEYEDGHVPNAVNIPLPDLASSIDEIPQDKPVILVCKSGGRSAMAADFLSQNGFTNLTNLLGGTDGWISSGFDVAYPD